MKLSELTGLFKWKEVLFPLYIPELPNVTKLVHQGKCKLHSYGIGFYNINLYIEPTFKKKEKRKPHVMRSDGFKVLLSYTTIGSGVFEGRIVNLNLGGAIYIFEKVKELYKDVQILPDDAVMNKHLNIYGIKLEYN